MKGGGSFTHPASRVYDTTIGNANYRVDSQQTLCNYITACREALRNRPHIADVMRR